MIKIQYNGQEKIVPVTIFPDGTSQVWKIGIEDIVGNDVKIVWEYQFESELLHLIQLVHLLTSYEIEIKEIFIPYLPYGRQDKVISDNTTFALFPMMYTLKMSLPVYTVISTLDSHSNVISVTKNYSPQKYIQQAIECSDTDFIVFPDNGAMNRYVNMIDEMPYIVVDKIRDQITGNITGLDFNDSCEITKQTIQKISMYDRKINLLIVDDIADGGMTFIKTSELLHQKFDCNVDLYVTHGIFSKGIDTIKESGIINIYTTSSLKNHRLDRNIIVDEIEI